MNGNVADCESEVWLALSAVFVKEDLSVARLNLEAQEKSFYERCGYGTCLILAGGGLSVFTKLERVLERPSLVLFDNSSSASAEAVADEAMLPASSARSCEALLNDGPSYGATSGIDINLASLRSRSVDDVLSLAMSSHTAD